VKKRIVKRLAFRHSGDRKLALTEYDNGDISVLMVRPLINGDIRGFTPNEIKKKRVHQAARSYRVKGSYVTRTLLSKKSALALREVLNKYLEDDGQGVKDVY